MPPANAQKIWTQHTLSLPAQYLLDQFFLPPHSLRRLIIISLGLFSGFLPPQSPQHFRGIRASLIKFLFMIHYSIKGMWLFTWVHFCAVLVQFCKFWHGGASASETIQLGAHFSLTYNWGRAQIYGAPICINVMRLGAFQLLEYQMVSNQRVCRFYIKLGVSTAQQLLSSLSCNTCGNCNVRGYMGYMEVPWWNGACAGLWFF